MEKKWRLDKMREEKSKRKQRIENRLLNLMVIYLATSFGMFHEFVCRDIQHFSKKKVEHLH
jgi:hypothetical protein